MLQSGHGMWDGRRDRRTDGVQPVYPPIKFVVRGGGGGGGGGYNDIWNPSIQINIY